MTDPIVESVRKKLLERSEAGLLKYKTGLFRTDLLSFGIVANVGIG